MSGEAPGGEGKTCPGCGGLGWIPAGDEQLGCIDCNGTGHAPAPPSTAVAEAAVEWEAADAEQRRVPEWSRDTDLFERMLFRYQSATRALRAAVRGEEKTS